jgi:carboxymethylenebutenolidase
MAIKGEWIRYGDESGYLAYPDHAALPLPGVIVIQEVFGVEDHIEDVSRRIAAAGYVALAPDLYAKNGRRPDALARERIAEAVEVGSTLPPGTLLDPKARETALASLPEEKRLRIVDTVTHMYDFRTPGRIEGFVEKLILASRALRHERSETRGKKVACVGFCMGGGLSALLACEEEDLAGAAIYYGNTPPPEKLARLKAPVIGFYGELDQRVNAGIPAFTDGLARQGRAYEHKVYPRATHAFFNDTRPSYNVDAARDSWAKLMDFFNRNLGG